MQARVLEFGMTKKAPNGRGIIAVLGGRPVSPVPVDPGPSHLAVMETPTDLSCGPTMAVGTVSLRNGNTNTLELKTNLGRQQDSCRKEHVLIQI